MIIFVVFVIVFISSPMTGLVKLLWMSRWVQTYWLCQEHELILIIEHIVCGLCDTHRRSSWSCFCTADGSVSCPMLMLARSVFCVYRTSTVKWKTCISRLPRRLQLSTRGLRTLKKTSRIQSAVTQSRRLRSVVWVEYPTRAMCSYCNYFECYFCLYKCNGDFACNLLLETF